MHASSDIIIVIPPNVKSNFFDIASMIPYYAIFGATEVLTSL